MVSEKHVSKIFYFIVLVCFAAAAVVLQIIRQLGYSVQEFITTFIPPCSFRETLGIYCPGCGGARSFGFLIHGDFIQSFVYHPFIVYAAVLLVLFLIIGTISLLSRGHISMPILHPVYFYVGAGIIILQWIVKLVFLLVFDIALIPF